MMKSGLARSKNFYIISSHLKTHWSVKCSRGLKCCSAVVAAAAACQTFIQLSLHLICRYILDCHFHSLFLYFFHTHTHTHTHTFTLLFLYFMGVHKTECFECLSDLSCFIFDVVSTEFFLLHSSFLLLFTLTHSLSITLTDTCTLSHTHSPSLSLSLSHSLRDLKKHDQALSHNPCKHFSLPSSFFHSRVMLVSLCFELVFWLFH